MALGLKKPNPLALDIGASSLVAVQAAGNLGHLKLRGCYEWPLSEGLVVDGEVADVDLLARELKAFVNHFGLRGRYVNIAVGNQKVIVRNIDMPDMTEAELRGAIEFQAGDYIPIPVDEVVLDFQVVDKRVTLDGVARQEVLLVAAQKAMISMFTAALRQAGLRVTNIDVISLALMRALLPPTSFLSDPGAALPCRGIADISSSVSTLVVAVGEALKFTRTINFSSDNFSLALVRELGIMPEDARNLLQRVGLPGPLPPDNELYSEEVIADVQRKLLVTAGEIGEELRRSLHYYQGQPGAVPLKEIVLSGRGALVRNLDAYLADSLGLPVTIGNPLLHFVENASKLPDTTLAYMAPYLSTAVGLALPAEE